VRLTRLLVTMRGAKRIGELADQIARRSQDPLWQRVGRRAATMTPAEAKGYIRAWSAEVIVAQIDLARVAHRELSEADESRLTTAARERVVEMLLSRIRAARSREAARRAA